MADENEDLWDRLKARLRDTSGELAEDGISVRFGGACPVQGYGTIAGRACYYRSRGGNVRLDMFGAGVSPEEAWEVLPEPEWSYSETSTAEDWGWEDADFSIAFLKRAAAAWRKQMKEAP